MEARKPRAAFSKSEEWRRVSVFTRPRSRIILQTDDLGGRMYAVIGRVKIKPGHEEETRSMIAEHGVAMIQGMAGSAEAYWARAVDGELIQQSFWLFDTEENPRKAKVTFNGLREMPDAPAMFVSCDVCEVVGQA
jgi:hypothetical protein